MFHCSSSILITYSHLLQLFSMYARMMTKKRRRHAYFSMNNYSVIVFSGRIFPGTFDGSIAGIPIANNKCVNWKAARRWRAASWPIHSSTSSGWRSFSWLFYQCLLSVSGWINYICTFQRFFCFDFRFVLVVVLVLVLVVVVFIIFSIIICLFVII